MTKAKSAKEELEVLNSFYEKELGSRIKKVVNPIAYDWLIRSLSKITRASYMEGLEDGIEQGKKDGIKEESDRHSGVRREWYKRGHDVGYGQGKVDGIKDMHDLYCKDCKTRIRKQTYSEVLKEYKTFNSTPNKFGWKGRRYMFDFRFRQWLEQKLKAME